MKEIDEIKRDKNKWVQDCLNKRPIKEAKSVSGFDLDVVYTPADLDDFDYKRDLGFPGEYPYTRGVYSSMYRSSPWTMRQYAGFGTAEETNERYKYLLKEGNTGLSVAFDLATQMGFDSDDPMVEEEVGRVGVAVDTVKDMETIFHGMPLDKITTSFTINGVAPIILAMYVVVAEKQGVPLEKIGGTLQNDILKEYIARGTWLFPPGPSLRLVTDIIEYCTRNLPRFNPISICGAHLRGAGANPVQEGAYTLSNAITYVNYAMKRGLDVDSFAPRLSFLFANREEFFEEIAKMRAIRRLWARIMKERFGAKDPKSMMLRVFASGGAGIDLTKEQPETNIIRAAIGTLGVVLGGAQAIMTCPYDEAYAIPTENSERIALRTQQIIAYESGVTKVVDPLGGSYYVEFLTNRIEGEMKKMMADVEKKGGMVKLIESGYVQGEILKGAYEEEKKLISGEKAKVGVNMFRIEEEVREFELHQMSADTLKNQLEKLKEVKKKRNEQKVKSSLDRLRSVLKGDENTIPYIIDVVREYGTVGEITVVMKEVFGKFREPSIV
ncbi:MAG: methylmalonyl-CoA mutase [Deltaproteobacteria bacterium CG12_big_fil_rev_8_21_14_0_65_43_10]|nr:MAG: methylmalonyl-CoA mutase [Deltaproteobacteria bacterium CG2_30_43_15]PIQ46591.1 MAG: methylmalonyl-CoA mutase [Deltaproteobacteria bacterium CG12_big_fil_rev_8_21_14_0_65_43_10]PIU86063.1 MAG: methylmalonyl-CoA mutase [Deltaproteobacteria bacterium CG06_land_8_20_14_3_00_44_19]PIX25929.1 MAG: methylmalonyl-CoA mutase [Deltaproteobacteria bacterium CG_4_8_14_3_um_filter_43_13]PIZ20387.1 MAG: methylmalonyl-CoA mutase [Deltaproteobacteria bacterium CG_4_10_14_0_8_um_filter_43_12]HCX90479.